MIARALSIAALSLREIARSAPARFGLVLLLIAVPLAELLAGREGATRVHVARMVSIEGLRLLLPLAAVVGAAFVLKPALRRGYALLPARRDEWFLGASLAGLAMSALSVALFATGAALTFVTLGDAGRSVRPAYPAQAGFTGAPTTSAGEDWLWADPAGEGRPADEIVLHFDVAPVGPLSGEVTYELILTGGGAPARGVPFDVYAGESRAEVRAISGRRAAFTAPAHEGPVVLRIVPSDSALKVGLRPARVFISAEVVSAVPALLGLALVALAAAALCITFTLLVRSRLGAAIAALAGLLLVAALTLLPGLTPAGQMAADRRRAIEGEETQAIKLERALSQLPELMPATAFDEFLSGRTVGPLAGEAVWRALAALALLPAGALLFRRRQIQ